MNPMRLADALTAIRPRLVILDSELNDVARLAEQARLRSCQGTVVASDGDRATVTRLLDSM